MLVSCQEGRHRPALSLFAKVSLDFSCKLPKATCFQKFAFAKRSGAMKAPVGLLSDRTVLRSKMEGPRPDYGHLRACSGWWRMGSSSPKATVPSATGNWWSGTTTMCSISSNPRATSAWRRMPVPARKSCMRSTRCGVRRTAWTPSSPVGSAMPWLPTSAGTIWNPPTTSPTRPGGGSGDLWASRPLCSLILPQTAGGQGFANLWPPACPEQECRERSSLPQWYDAVRHILLGIILSGAKWRQIQQFCCFVLSRNDVEMEIRKIIYSQIIYI